MNRELERCFGRYTDWFVCVLLQDLHKQLEEVTKDTEIVEIRQREAECELEASRDRVQQQATEILLKASEIYEHALPSPHSPLFNRTPLGFIDSSFYIASG